jgi:hypothetical protein
MATFANNANNAAAFAAFQAVLETGNLPAIKATWGALFQQAAPAPTPPSTPAPPKRTAVEADLDEVASEDTGGEPASPCPPPAPKKKAKKTKKVTLTEPVEVVEPEAVEAEPEAEPAAKPLSKKAQKALKRPRPLSAYNVFMSEFQAKLKKKNWNPDQLEGAALTKARFTHATAEWKKVPEGQRKGKWQDKADEATATRVAAWEAGQPLAEEDEE